MHHQPRRLVYDDELIIFVDDMEADVLGFGRYFFLLRRKDMEVLAGFDSAGGVFDRYCIACHMSLGDEFF